MRLPECVLIIWVPRSERRQAAVSAVILL